MSEKEKYIIKQFGDLWETLNQTSKKCALKHDGWISTILDHIPNQLEYDFSTEKCAWRPKSLVGVEDNNGWHLIKEELTEENQTVLWYNIDNGDFTLSSLLEDGFNEKDYSHWTSINPRGPKY